ncbi:WhiB family transcriptional regulator [Solihabitans fulvus]|uniref:Transcriptional regulator WhiB n=1 Tax=Solihabitans fulvus TaxID=1892852 RepID=A0A5B2WPT3_9PSEU|nr:WhiB family transcriptional regulator [Solihabitans fulvus]KAA2252536.1 WhiB family transcriptional regulator [Solihabitans fulvus]
MTETSRLPVPVTDEWDWQLQARCRGANSTLFFHPDAERGSARERREERAKAICRACPVRTECREHALQVEEQYGVWGALGESERRAMIVDRRRLARQHAV